MPYNKLFLGNYRNTILTNASVWDENAIGQTSTRLLNSKHYNEQLSWALNHYLLENYEPEMCLIHHYYTAEIAFPWQFAKFDYKDIALHPWWTTHATKIISWHLHKAFIHEHYVCVWSMRSTTSGERDHAKYLWQWDTTKEPWLQAIEIAINPYLTIEGLSTVTVESIQDTNKKIHAEHAKVLPWISITDTERDLQKTSIIVYSNESIENIESMIDPTIKATLQDIQIKQKNNQHEDMTDLLDIWQYNIQQSLLDRKELVKKYLMSRYWTESEKYRTLLSELNIL
jgi:hypothetical protein